MNYKIIGEIREESNGELKGTCFLISPKYVLTANHVVKDIKDAKVIFKFIGVTRKIKKVIYENYDDIDLSIFELDIEVQENIKFCEFYATVPIEQGEGWETSGYPEDIKFDMDNKGNRYTYLNGCVNREIENEKCDYELIIYNQRQLTDWEGLSGAPVLINDKVVGIIVGEHTSQRLKTKLKIVSTQKIINFLADCNEEQALKVLSYKCKSLLTDRAELFHRECSEKFIYLKGISQNINSDCFILKRVYSCLDIANLIDLFLKDYANELKDLVLLEDKDLMVRRQQDRIVNKVTTELKKQLIKDNKVSLVLLWIILEGNYSSIRLASTYSLTNENQKQDIYICNTNTGIKLLIGYAEMQEDIVQSIDKILSEIDEEKILGKEENRIIVWDELAINYLDFATKTKLDQIRSNEIENDKLEIVLLYSYNSDIFNKVQYKNHGDNTDIVKRLIKKELEMYNNEISEICSKFEWIKETKINWVVLPIESLDEFNTAIL